MKEVVQEALVSLEVQGLLRKTGEPRRGVAGDLQPIYVATTMSKWLDETRLIDDFEEYLKLTARQTGSTN
jgi:hypothetical protein